MLVARLCVYLLQALLFAFLSSLALGTIVGCSLPDSPFRFLRLSHFLLHDVGLVRVHCDAVVLGFVAGVAAVVHGSIV